jgi:aryl-alcohol dehydrogenase-like predicted oxidoreductase
MKYNLPTITLGRTGLTVTRLGIGGAYCKTVEGYQAALDMGVTYVDTARAYEDGKDEEIVGQALVGRRENLVLASKTVVRDAEGARKELETSLRLLRTDHLDIWQIHYLNTQEEREQVLGPGGAYEAALKARDEGLIRFIGVTGHNWEEVGKAVATGLFDTVLCWYNCAMKEPEDLIFPHAQKHNTGVVIMSAGRRDKLFEEPGSPPPESFYRYVLSHPAVHVSLFGLRNLETFERVAQGLAERDTLVSCEREELEKYGKQLRDAGKLEL